MSEIEFLRNEIHDLLAEAKHLERQNKWLKEKIEKLEKERGNESKRRAQ